MQRDRLRSVLLVLQGRQTLEVTAAAGRGQAFGQRWAYTERDGGFEAVQGRTPPGRRPRTRFVQRVKTGPAPRDGVASLREKQIQGTADREFNQTFSLNGAYQLLERHGFVCLQPRPEHPRRHAAAARIFNRRVPLL